MQLALQALLHACLAYRIGGLGLWGGLMLRMMSARVVIRIHQNRNDRDDFDADDYIDNIGNTDNNADVDNDGKILN